MCDFRAMHLCIAALLLLLQGCSNTQNRPTAQHEQSVSLNEEETVEAELEQDDDKCYIACPNEHHPHSINLGLHSGTIWSCCNIGASAPEGVGGITSHGERPQRKKGIIGILINGVRTEALTK